ncbi:MAG TPA: nitrous oxide reductase family maturation protein NosD [Chryseolinea sp.]|nr:nitrous oxide reductase family maturation protein NosD [Chryseolinea sp.]
MDTDRLSFGYWLLASRYRIKACGVMLEACGRDFRLNKILLLAFIIFSLFTTTSFGHTIKIGPQESIHTIKQGVSVAKSGDTLLIKPGIYREGNIIIEKSITIIGENYPTMDGENKYEIFTIHAQNITVNGLKFINTGIASMTDLAAIKVLDSKNVRILNNTFNNTFFGIYFSNSFQSWVENNEIESNGETEHQIANGIHMWKCEHMTVHNNRVKGQRDGIYFEFVTSSLITNNYSEGNIRYGLHFMFSHNNEYRNNTFINNGAGVAVMYTKNVKMIGNTFKHNWGSSAYGLLLKDIRDSEVRDNIYDENTVGIHLEGVSRTTFHHNLFIKNGYAVRLQASCDDNVFTKNSFKRNTFDIATNGATVLNTINGNYWDKYEGYDLNKDGIGDVPFHPVSMYAMIVERVPPAVLLWRSFLVFLMDRAEKAVPAVTPESLKDNSPYMKSNDLHPTGK